MNKVEPIWAGRCQEEKDCAICGVGIEIGQIEYEATWGDVAMYLHRHCVEL